MLRLSLPFLLCLIVLPLRAQQGSGGYAESYLRREAGVRAIGLGGAYVAVANESNAIFYNPAGLAFMSSRPQFSTMYTFLQYDRQHNILSYGQTVNEYIGVGAGINNFRAGTFTARNAAGQPLGDRTNQQIAAQGAIAFKFRNTSLGIGAKYLLNSLEGADIRGDGWGLDIGMKTQVADILSVGLAVQNIAGAITWNNNGATSDRLPFTLRAGIATELGFNEQQYKVRSNVLGEVKTVKEQATAYMLLSLEGSITQHDNMPKFSLGVEVAPSGVIAFRTGTAFYEENRSGQPLFNFNDYGFGVSLKPSIEELPFSFALEYAASHDRIAAAISHHLAIVLEF